VTERPRFLAITGTTASGKTDLSLALAERMPVEIVSMDSRQVYVGTDVGTDKVREAGRAAVPHHGLDLVRPSERYSAGHFARDARRWIEEIRSRGALPVLVGGTGFFLRAVLQPMFREPPLDPLRRERLRRYLDTRPPEYLARAVSALDPGRAALALEGGRQRMSRTIEVALLSGVPLSRWHREAPEDGTGVPGLVVVLDLPRDETNRRIDDRVGRMVERGLVEEVRGLLEAGYGEQDPGMSGTGYPEITAFLGGELMLERAMDQIRRNTRRYARRQRTWFRNQLPESSVRIDATQPLPRQVEAVIAAMRDAALAVPWADSEIHAPPASAGDADRGRS
jgi:tRNA dimethylallyltransferase